VATKPKTDVNLVNPVKKSFVFKGIFRVFGGQKTIFHDHYGKYGIIS